MRKGRVFGNGIQSPNWVPRNHSQKATGSRGICKYQCHSNTNNNQCLFLVPLIGGRYHIIPQLAVYTTYIPLIVLAFWGVKMLPSPPKGNQKPPLNHGNLRNSWAQKRVGMVISLIGLYIIYIPIIRIPRFPMKGGMTIPNIKGISPGIRALIR